MRKQRSSSPATHPTSTPRPNLSSPDGVQAGHAAGPWQLVMPISHQCANSAKCRKKLRRNLRAARIWAQPMRTPWANDIWASRSSAVMPILPDPVGGRGCIRVRGDRIHGRSDGVTVTPPSRMPPFTIRKTAAGIGLPSVLRNRCSNASPDRPTGIVASTISHASRSARVWIRRTRSEVANRARIRSQSRQKTPIARRGSYVQPNDERQYGDSGRRRSGP